MPRRLRFVPPRDLIEVTCRTIQGRHLLRPGKQLNEIVLGVLARAQKLHSVQVCDFAVLSNHYHLLLVPETALELTRFMNYFNSNLAREAGRLYDWPSRFWEDRYSSIPITNEEAAQVARLRYVLSQGCKEGLVASPVDWPGATSVRARLHGTPLVGIWTDRTALYRARLRGRLESVDDFRHEVTVALSPIPCWAHLDSASYRERYVELIHAIEVDAEREQVSRRSSAGVESLTRRHPHFRPAQIKKGPAPLVHAVTKAIADRFREAYARFVNAYREAASRLRAGLIGGLELSFPEGCFPPPLPFVESS
jgi:hypothetical protein